MSEYQYYEFQAIDRPLTKQEMAELRAISTRATITPTRFMNVYNYGHFRGDPEKLLEKYFDIFAYEANWGTRRLLIRLPGRLFDLQMASPYYVPDVVSMKTSGDYAILEFRSGDEDAGGWIEEEESEQWVPALLSLRADLINGDLRSMYLGWLSFVQVGLFEGESESDDESEPDDDDLDEDEYEGDYPGLDRNQIEPPVPPGLGHLTASLQALADFLRIDQDLIAVAAKRSSDIITPPTAEFNQWLLALPVIEKDALLLKLLQGDNPFLRNELWLRFRQSHPAAGPVKETEGELRRTVGELLQAAKAHAVIRKRDEARRKAENEARRAREEAAARAKYLDSITGRDEDLWRQVETLVEAKKAGEYDQATQLLKDLQDLSARSGDIDAYKTRLGHFRDRYPTRLALIKRLDKEGLR